MQTWDVLADKILTAATTDPDDPDLPLVDVARALIAPGPDFARDCRMIAVHLEQPQTRPFPGDFGFAACASLTQLVFRVTFVADCVPGPDVDGNPPPPDEITLWSKEFLADANLIADALADLCAGTDLCDDCSGVSLGDGQPTGPGGGVATMSWPVTVVNT